MRRIIFGTLSLLLVLITLVGLISCSDGVTEVTAGAYVCEGMGVDGDDFTVYIREDGSFNYTAGVFSSYIGVGDWTQDGDVLCLEELEGRRNYFRVEKDALVYLYGEPDYLGGGAVFDGEERFKLKK